MSSLIDGLAQELQGDTLQKLSRQLGADEGATTQAITMALPALLAGLARNVDAPGGAQALDQALERDHDGSVLDNLSAVLRTGDDGGGVRGLNARALNGAGILEHVLGMGRAPVEQGISKSTGLDAQKVSRLLMMLAPIVMAYLGRQKRQQNMGADNLGTSLRNERQEIERRAPGAGGLLEQMLGGAQGAGNQPGIGDDLARMAPSILGAIFGRR